MSIDVDGGSSVQEAQIIAAQAVATRRATRDPALRRLLLAGDLLAVLLALLLAVTAGPAATGSHNFLWGLFALPLMALLFKLYGLYDRDVKRISHSTVDDLPWLFHATVIGALLLWLYSRSTPMGRLDFARSSSSASGSWCW